MVVGITDKVPAGLVFHPAVFNSLFSSPDIQPEKTCVADFRGLKIATSDIIPANQVLVLNGNNTVIEIINLST